jgi:hypothetical protein
MTTLRATTDLVAVTWLNSLFPTPVAVTTLPKDTTAWSTTGAIVIATIGGTSNMYVPLRGPVVSLDCWAVAPNSAKPPWGKANYLAEVVQAACYDHQGTPRTLTLPGQYPQARVLSAYTVQDPRRVTEDPASYARYNLAVQLAWVELP